MMDMKRRATDFRNRQRYEQAEIILVIATFTVVILAGLILAFWALWPYQTIEVKNVKMEKSILRQGEVTNYSTDYVKYMPTYSVHRFFVDGLIFDAGSSDPARPIGAGHGVQPIQIPRTLPPGKYRIHVIATFKPNPIRTIEYAFDTPQFIVLEAIDKNTILDIEATVSN
jgi:hypothetical protein